MSFCPILNLYFAHYKRCVRFFFLIQHLYFPPTVHPNRLNSQINLCRNKSKLIITIQVQLNYCSMYFRVFWLQPKYLCASKCSLDRKEFSFVFQLAFTTMWKNLLNNYAVSFVDFYEALLFYLYVYFRILSCSYCQVTIWPAREWGRHALPFQMKLSGFLNGTVVLAI